MAQKGFQRSKDQILHDNALIAKMLLRGKSTRKITDEVNKQYKENLTIEWVRVEIKKIRKRWGQDAKDAIEEKVGEQLKKLELVQKEAMDAWEEAKKQKETTIMEVKEVYVEVGGENGMEREKIPGEQVKKTTKFETKDPDPRYLFAFLEASKNYLEVIKPGGAADEKSAQEQAAIVRRALTDIDTLMN